MTTDEGQTQNSRIEQQQQHQSTMMASAIGGGHQGQERINRQQNISISTGGNNYKKERFEMKHRKPCFTSYDQMTMATADVAVADGGGHQGDGGNGGHQGREKTASAMATASAVGNGGHQGRERTASAIGNGGHQGRERTTASAVGNGGHEGRERHSRDPFETPTTKATPAANDNFQGQSTWPSTTTPISKTAVRLVPQSYGSEGTQHKLSAGNMEENKVRSTIAADERMMMKQTRVVSWGKAYVREYKVILGNHPAGKEFTLTLDWAHSTTRTEEPGQGSRRKSRRLGRHERRNRLELMEDDPFEHENWRWLKGTVLEREPLEAILAFQRWFESKVIQLQAESRGFLVRRRMNKGNTSIEDEMYEFLWESLMMKANIDEGSYDSDKSFEDENSEDDMNELHPFYLIDCMRKMDEMDVDAHLEMRKLRKPVEYRKEQTQDTVMMLENLLLESTEDASPDLSQIILMEKAMSELLYKQAVRKIQAHVRSFITRKHITDKREQEQALERQRQELRLRKVHFTMLVTEYCEDGTGQAVHRKVPTMNGKEWRIKSFQSRRKWHALTQDEKAIRMEQRRKIQTEQRQLEQQQLQLILKMGHWKLEKQRAKDAEAHQRRAEEVRRQLKGKATRQRLETIQPWHPTTHSSPPKPKPVLARNRSTTRDVYSKVSNTSDQHHSSTAPPHRKVVRKKLPRTPLHSTHPLTRPTQGHTIFNQALRQQPFSTVAQHPSPNLAQQTPIHRKALRQQPFGLPPGRRNLPLQSSHLRPTSWHQAWISPTHRKTLRQQPF